MALLSDYLHYFSEWYTCSNR